MNELKKKVFRVLLLIFTAFTVVIIVISNVQTYRQEYHETVAKFSGVGAAPNDERSNKPSDTPPSKPSGDDEKEPEQVSQAEDVSSLEEPESIGNADNENLQFADAVVYTVKLSQDNEIESVTNHTQNDVGEDEIREIAQEILSSGKQGINVGNLYTERYSYCLNSGETLTVIDNSTVNKKLTEQLILSFALFAAIEIVIIISSKRITAWITKPVEESFEKQKQFIADASHELKTPLSVIMASSDALEREPNEKKWLLNIKSEAERMNKLIKSLLDLARTQQETETAPNEDCDISKAVETSLLAFEGVMFEKNISLNYDIEKGIVRKADTDSIKQLTAILADNAVCHSEKGSAVTVTLKKDGSQAALSVINRGEPIPEGDEERIFERFYRGDKARSRNDNRYGLGLAIAKNIVERHGGKISAHSENGETTFKVVL